MRLYLVSVASIAICMMFGSDFVRCVVTVVFCAAAVPGWYIMRLVHARKALRFLRKELTTPRQASHHNQASG